MERVFVAIYPGEKVIKKLNPLQEEIKGAISGQMIPPANIHLTLQFIGWIGEDVLEKITKNIFEVTRSIEPFEVSYRSVEFFPNESRPRILWVGIEENASVLSRIAQKLNQENREFLNRRERGQIFLPHITLARIKHIDKTKIRGIIQKYSNFYFGKEEIHEVCLVKSELKREGAKYSIIERFPLEGK